MLDFNHRTGTGISILTWAGPRSFLEQGSRSHIALLSLKGLSEYYGKKSWNNKKRSKCWSGQVKKERLLSLLSLQGLFLTSNRADCADIRQSALCSPSFGKGYFWAVAKGAQPKTMTSLRDWIKVPISNSQLLPQAGTAFGMAVVASCSQVNKKTSGLSLPKQRPALELSQTSWIWKTSLLFWSHVMLAKLSTTCHVKQANSGTMGIFRSPVYLGVGRLARGIQQENAVFCFYWIISRFITLHVRKGAEWMSEMSVKYTRGRFFKYRENNSRIKFEILWNLPNHFIFCRNQSVFKKSSKKLENISRKSHE